jgi:hypothetical protein
LVTARHKFQEILPSTYEARKPGVLVATQREELTETKDYSNKAKQIPSSSQADLLHGHNTHHVFFFIIHDSPNQDTS